MSEEKRRHKRIPTEIRITIDSLYKQDDVVISALNEEIEIINISKSGVGFVSVHDLPLGFYFNARISMDEEKQFYGVLRIIRKQEEFPEKDDFSKDSIFYGCEFIGLADILSSSIDEYGKEKGIE
jgi:hypothetical protein